MLTPGSKLPEFKVPACVSIEKGKEFKDITNKDFSGKWVVFYSYPKDFTFVCPTEIVEFDKKLKDFGERDAIVFGGSTDNEHSHLAWRQNHADLKGLHHPLLFISPSLGGALGIVHPEAGDTGTCRIREVSGSAAVEKARGKHTAKQHAEHEGEVPPARGAPIVPEIPDTTRHDDRAHVAQVARDAEHPVAHQQQARHEQADERTGHVPWPWLRKRTDQRCQHASITCSGG